MSAVSKFSQLSHRRGYKVLQLYPVHPMQDPVVFTTTLLLSILISIPYALALISNAWISFPNRQSQRFTSVCCLFKA